MDEGEKLLARMRVSKAGWKPRDLERLYLAFDFEIYEGGNHRVYRHRRFRELRATVPRHSPIKNVYVAAATKLIDELKRLEVEHE